MRISKENASIGQLQSELLANIITNPNNKNWG